MKYASTGQTTRNTQPNNTSPAEIAEKAAKLHAQREKQALDKNPQGYIAKHTISGHSFENHVANSHRSLLNNVLTGWKRGDAAFADAETQAFCTQELLYEKMRDIHNFVHSTKVPNGKTQIFAMAFSDPETGEPKYIGDGYISDTLDKKKNVSGKYGVGYAKTNAAAIVVKKNFRAPDGWEITTVYPILQIENVYQLQGQDLSKASIIRPEKDFKGVLHETEAYQEASPAKKLFMDKACSSNKTSPTCLPYYQQQRDTVLFINPQVKNGPGIRVDSQMRFTLNMPKEENQAPQSIHLNYPRQVAIAKKVAPSLYQEAVTAVQENAQVPLPDIIKLPHYFADTQATSQQTQPRQRSQGTTTRPQGRVRTVSDMGLSSSTGQSSERAF